MPTLSRNKAHGDFLSLSLAEIAAWQLHKLLDPSFGVGQAPVCMARLPALQRGAIWKQSQVELLWDSILRQFPIGALVLTPNLRGQKARLGEYSDKDWVDELGVRHHLLDGQQRANAIALGFYDPFHLENRLEADKDRAILWLDISLPKHGNTRQFLFRLTTLAHPWGFKDDDTAGRLEAPAMRDALKKYGCGNKANVGMARRPAPREAWPHRATAPVPFAWVLQAAATSTTSEEFCSKLMERSKALEASYRIQIEMSLQSLVALLPLFTAVQGALNMRLVAFAVPDQALSLSAENKAEDNQDIASVEHLFQRLNAGGTVPSSEEMAYSMIKAYWPEVEEPIRELMGRRMPEARLFMLSVRLATGATVKLGPGHAESGKQLPGSFSVEAVRRIALQGKNEGDAKSIYEYFAASTPDTLKPVLAQVGEWLESRPERDRHGLPPELHSSIANRSPEVYLLLMWLSRRRCIQQSDATDTSMRGRILALATALHWFRPLDAILATRLIAKELDHRFENGSDLFRGLLSTVVDQDQNQAGILLPLTPENLREAIGTLPNHKELETWGWWRIARDAQEAPTEANRFIVAVKDNRELLMYA